jgi:hypothetical protein
LWVRLHRIRASGFFTWTPILEHAGDLNGKNQGRIP